jgi:hypothetical protein
MDSSDDLCHPECEPGRGEQRVRDIVAALLGDDSLSRVCEKESSRPKPDFRSAHHSVEIKELASPSLRSFLNAQKLHIGDVRLYPVDGPQKTWGVSVDVSLATDSFEQAPTPKVRRLIDALAPLVAQLEAKGLDDALLDSEIWPRIAQLIHHDGWCSVIPGEAFAPGIFFAGHGYGQARTTYLEDDVVAFLQHWLDSPQADNARQSLAGEAALRCVALVASMEGPAAAMLRTLEETRGEQLRTGLTLPEEIDAVVVITDAEVLDYGLVDGWRRRAIESLPGI